MAKMRLKVRRERQLTTNEETMQLARQLFAANATLSRAALLRGLGIDSRRSINAECGYPDQLTSSDYQIMYDREGIATKVVNIYPEESWVVDPLIQETAEVDETPFEKEWIQLEEEKQLYSIMMRADEVSGIGSFGIILLGWDDGGKLNEPLEGINEKTGERIGNPTHKLLYARPFSQSCLTIKACETDLNSPRYGQPTMYTIKFQDTNTAATTDTATGAKVGRDTDVHWTRCIHLADNKKSSEVYGVPRMQTLFNRLYDIRKIAGGSGEMFWKGGFPGISYQMDANAKALTDPQKKELKTEIANYADGLQRYMTLQGIDAKSLAPQVADPKNHVEIQITIIAISISVPKRVFMGAEQAKLASSQDAIVWNKRLGRRQNKYLSPGIIRPFIDRLIAAGALSEPAGGYKIVWPDLDSPSDKDKAEVTAKYVEAFAKYVGGGVANLIPEDVFFKIFTDLTPDQIKEIEAAGKRRIRELEDEDEELERQAAEEEGQETNEDDE